MIVSGDAHNMALYGILMAKALGVASIDFADDDGARLDAAAALGANPLDLRAGRLSDLYPIVVDCSADPKRLGLALACVGHAGVCHNVWPHPISISLPVTAMFLRNVTFVTGRRMPAPTSSLCSILCGRTSSAPHRSPARFCRGRTRRRPLALANPTHLRSFVSALTAHDPQTNKRRRVP